MSATPSNPDEAAGTVSISGPVTITEAAHWRAVLLAAFERGTTVRIDLAASGPWDLCGVQLLISAVATGRQAGRPVELVAVPGVLWSLVEQAGLTAALAGSVSSRLG
jgi:ABC-type transporter Mla MlaB component